MDKHRKALELAGHAGCILLKNGAEIFRVQETMIAHSLRLWRDG